MSHRISVVIPTYNRSEVLVRALRSVLAQTRPADEVIVVDDGSTDDTRGRLAREFPEITYIHQENQGVSAARNNAIVRARGNWIALLDSDDEWLPAKLERQLETVTPDPDAVLCHTNEIWIRNGRRVNPGRRHEKAGGWIFQRCLPLCAISPSAALIKRSLFDEVGLFDEGMPVCEDYDMWLRVCSRHAVHYVDEPLVVKYGGHDDQLSRRYWGMDRWRIAALTRVIDSNRLSTEDRDAAVVVMLNMIDIYLGGARKREKGDEIAALEKLKSRFAD